MPKKKKRRYGDYISEIDGKPYAVVRLPKGGGKYKKKVKLLSKISPDGSRIEAAKWAWNELALHKSKLFNRSEAAGWTFDKAAAWYKKEFLVAPVFENGVRIEGIKDFEKQKNKLDRMVEIWGAKPITTFTDDDFRAYTRHRRDVDKVKTATINRDFALLRSMFRRIGSQLGKGFEIPKFPINMLAEKERDRVLSFDEEKRILAACVEKEIITKKPKGKKEYQTEILARREHLRPLIILAVDTAMRLGEIVKLAWTDIDFDADTITVQFFNSKTQKTRKVGITPRVKAELLILYKSRKSEKVFGLLSPHRAFATACTRAGVEDFHFHDLRHTATTRMIRAGIPSAEVMKITGHSQVKTFLRYLNLVNETVQSNANQLAAFLDSQNIIEVSDAEN